MDTKLGEAYVIISDSPTLLARVYSFRPVNDEIVG
jgi:hypothetical protein